MTEAQYIERLERYRQQVERLLEIDEARQARAQKLAAQVEGLKVQAEYLRRQIWVLKYERGIAND